MKHATTAVLAVVQLICQVRSGLQYLLLAASNVVTGCTLNEIHQFGLVENALIIHRCLRLDRTALLLHLVERQGGRLEHLGFQLPSRDFLRRDDDCASILRIPARINR